MCILFIANYRYDRQESMQRYADMLEAGLRERGVSVRTIRPEPYFGRLKPVGHGVGKWLGYIDKFIIFPTRLRWIVRKSRNGAQCASGTRLSPGDHSASSARSVAALQHSNKAISADEAVQTGQPPVATVHRPSGELGSLIVHICDHSNAMYAAHLQGIPHLVTCHDLLAVRSALGHFPQNPVSWTGRVLQKWVLRGLRQAQAVVCISAATKTDLLNLLPGKSEVEVVLNALNYRYHPMGEQETVAALVDFPQVCELGTGGYLFHIGANQWYKNREGLLRIYFHYIRSGGRLPLVLAGKPVTLTMRRLIASAPTGACIIHVGQVSNEQLNALYARAACFVFPSLYEGFGWPVLEALTVGCPVVCSRRASLPEVGGEAATYIDPADEAESAKILQMALTESKKREANIRVGFAHARGFSNETMFSQLLEQYRRIVG